MAGVEFRASWTKLAMLGVKALPEPDRARVRAAIGEPRIQRVFEASSVDWLPGDIHLAVTSAIERELGVARAREFWRRRMAKSFETRLVKNFLSGLLRMFNPDPYTVLRASPPMYKLMARNAGVHEVSSPRRGVVLVRFRAVPPEVSTPGFYALCHGQCLGVFDLVKVPGRVTEKLTTKADFDFVLDYGAGSAGS